MNKKVNNYKTEFFSENGCTFWTVFIEYEPIISEPETKKDDEKGMDEVVRRVGYLFEEITSFENLVTAFRKAKKGAGKSPDSLKFFYNMESEILILKRELESGCYIPGEYRKFNIYEPKERIISVAPFRDRVVHHAVVNELEPVFENIFIFDSYATRKGKGTHKAVKKAQKFVWKHDWFLKSDIKSYFASIDICKLLEITERKIKDGKVLDLLEKIFAINSV